MILALYPDTFFCFNGLVQTLAIATTQHLTTRELVNDNYFEIRVIESAERFQTLAHRALGIIGANYHRDLGGPGRMGRTRTVERKEGQDVGCAKHFERKGTFFERV